MMIGKQIGPLPPTVRNILIFATANTSTIALIHHCSTLTTSCSLTILLKDEHKAAQIKSIVKLNTCMLELGNVSLIPTRSTANLKAEKILIKV